MAILGCIFYGYGEVLHWHGLAVAWTQWSDGRHGCGQLAALIEEQGKICASDSGS